MSFESTSELGPIQLEQYLQCNPYLEYAMKKPYTHQQHATTTYSNLSNRRNKPTLFGYQQLPYNQKDSLSLDRLTYKLRMKSDLNINTTRENPTRHRPVLSHQLPTLNETFRLIPSSAKSKPLIRQPTAASRGSNSMKTSISDEINGIEGSAVRIGTLKDLIKQYRRTEINLLQRSENSSDNGSAYALTSRSVPKSASFQTERIVRKAQALTEYHFNMPNLKRTPSSHTIGNRIKEKIDYIEFSSINDPYRQRIGSNERILNNKDKQRCICNKLNIIDPFHADQNNPMTRTTPVQYILPPIRPFGYFTRKSTEDLSRSTPLYHGRKRTGTKTKQNTSTKASVESLDRIPTTDDENSQLFNDTIKSLVSSTDNEDELNNPPNTFVNLEL